MHDQALVWTTDRTLQVTSLTARLRDLANIGSGTSAPVSVSDLWGKDDPSNIATAAHHWALDGEQLAFEATVRSGQYRFELQPLQDVTGTTIGVAGRAVEIQHHSSAQTDAHRHAERHAGMGTWHHDLRSGAVTISDGLALILGARARIGAFDIRAYDHEGDRAAIRRSIAAQSADDYTCDHRVRCPNSRVRVVRERLRTVLDDRGVPVARIGSLIDISDLKEREAELSELALHDALTRLPNRVALEERLAQALSRCERSDRRCAVLFIDLDDFKAINDSHGHDFGDRVLSSVAQRLNRHVRGSDTVARMGGDEFVVVIEELFSDDAALDAARKLLRSLDEPLYVGDRSVRMSASIGVATYPGAGTTPGRMLQLADREMYAVKRNGGSGVKLAKPEKETLVHADEKASWQVRYSRVPHHFATLESV